MEGKKCDQPCFDLVFSAAAKGTNPKFQWNITTMKEVKKYWKDQFSFIWWATIFTNSSYEHIAYILQDLPLNCTRKSLKSTNTLFKPKKGGENNIDSYFKSSQNKA